LISGFGQSGLLRARYVEARQKLARRGDPLSLEQLYQVSYFELAARTDWLSELPFSSPRGGTASFSQLYALLNLLRDGRFNRVLELGVGKSTALITQWVQASGGSSVHVDDDADWLAMAAAEQARVERIHAPLVATRVEKRDIRWYGCDRPEGAFDLVLVDGPQAWSRSSRYDRWGVLNWLPGVLADEFVIVLDDTSRRGERRLVHAAQTTLANAGRETKIREIVGANSQTLLVSPGHEAALYI
jgi:hypothetical protein